MQDEVTVLPKYMRLGEEKPLRIVIVDNEANADISSSSSTIEIWDSSGSASLTPTACTQSGTTRLELSYLLTTGSGKTLTSAGTYRIVWRWHLGSVYREWQQTLYLKARPS